ncbi:MAG: hypothetical protein OXU20_39520 [Myxococcales bacterium]|nr:hypothetical protein [Myxococcales bacterium]
MEAPALVTGGDGVTRAPGSLGGAGRALGKAVLVGWAALALLVLATLMVGHWYTLPVPGPEARPRVAAALSALRSNSDHGRWFAVHVLYTECRCSQRIFDHLFTSQRPAGVGEHVILVGPPEGYEERAKKAGFAVTVTEPEALRTRFGVEAAPLFLVADPGGTLRYAGGYTERKQGLEVRDLVILEALRGQTLMDELPAFGCAVSRSLQDLLDPLGVKYED